MDEKPQPVVFIIGAGLSGLLLAALLEKTHISYRVFERAAEVKPLGKKKSPCNQRSSRRRFIYIPYFHLGSVLSLGPTILPALEQLGLLEEIQKISLACPGVSLLDGNMKRLGDVKIKGEKKL